MSPAVAASPARPPIARPLAETIARLGTDAKRGLAQVDADARLRTQGPNDVPDAKTHPLLLFAKRFWGLSAWMIEAIAILSFVLHKDADVAIALTLLVANAILGSVQEQRASAAVSALKKKLEVSARAMRDGAWRTLPARDLVTGDLVRVRSGDFVPADLQLCDGPVQVDQSALTGESSEVSRSVGDAVHAGSTMRDGEATGVVIATGVRTYFGRTTQLVASARPKLHVEAVISRVVRWLLIIVAVLAAITFAKAMILRLPLREVLPVLLVLLMSAFTFETFLFFALWSLLSLRERRAFWRSRPSGALVVSLAAAALVGVLIGVHGAAELAPLSLRTTALIFACGAAASLGPNDLVKTFLCARVLTAGGKRRYPTRSATPAGIPIDGTPRGARSIDPRRGQR